MRIRRAGGDVMGKLIVGYRSLYDSNIVEGSISGIFLLLEGTQYQCIQNGEI